MKIQPGPDGQQCQPPGEALLQALAALRQEPQIVRLFADLRHEREQGGGGDPEQQQVEAAGRIAVPAGEAGPVVDRLLIAEGDVGEGRDLQHQPDRLGPQLQAGDEADAVGDDRDDHQRADDVGGPQRHAEPHLQRQRHDHRLDREQEEGEGGVDQGRDGRADIAESCAAGEQVDVDPVFAGVVADRQAGQENERADREDRRDCVVEPIGEGEGAADRLARQERDRAERSVGNAEQRPAPGATRREAQRVVLQGLVPDPLIVLPPHARDALPPCHGQLDTPVRPASQPRPVCGICLLRCNIRQMPHVRDPPDMPRC